MGVDAISKVTEANTTADLRDTSACVKLDLLERLKTDHHGTVLASGAEACVGVTAGLGLDLDTVLCSANNSILNVLLGLGKHNNGRLEGAGQVVRLHKFGVITVRGHLVRNILAVQALENTASSRRSCWLRRACACWVVTTTVSETRLACRSAVIRG